MEQRIIGFLDQFFEKDVVLGRVVANEGFLYALLSLDPASEYRFYLYDPKSFREYVSTLDLPAVRRDAVRVCTRQDLMSDMGKVDFFCFHMNDPLSQQTMLAVLRNRYARTLFPITSVPHSINYTAYASDFLDEIWPGTTPRDVICATSRAAVAVLEEYFRELHENYHFPDTWRGPHLRLLPLGVDTAALAPPEPEFRQAARGTYRIPDDAVVCLVHGRITVDDKMDLLPLLFAVQRVLAGEDPPKLHVLISGHIRTKDTYPDVLRAVAKRAGISLQIVADPSREEVRQIYAASDIFISPSDNIQETFGLTLLEAGAMELPAIVSDWDGYRDLVLDGETGSRIPTCTTGETERLDLFAHILPDNIHDLFRAEQTVVDVTQLARAIQRLAVSPGLRQQMGKRAREHVTSTYDWKCIIRRWISLVEELRSIPISPEEERVFREARHPGCLQIARIFGHHPTESLAGEDLLSRSVRLSERGKRMLENRDVAVCWPNLSPYMHGVDLRKISVLARKGCTAARIQERLRPDGIDEERFRFIVLWMIKQDILEFAENADQ